MWFIYSTLAVLVGLLLDFAFGDPNVWWHPICLIGRLISKTEKCLRKDSETGLNEEKSLATAVNEESRAIAAKEKKQGFVLVVTVCLISTLVPSVLLLAAYMIYPVLGFLLESIMCWFLLAGKSLCTESMKVKKALENEGLEAGRYAVSMIVGRDTNELTQEGVVKATVETVAENTSDGIIAPLFYMLILGAPLGFLYKSINTMDSMVAYKNDKYINFGFAAAKLDDAANFIPARLSGLFMIAGAYIAKGYSGKDAFDIFKRDRLKHASPNSAQTESVMAGALGVQLAGDAVYFGKKYEKPFIGDFTREIETADIEKACRLMYITSTLFAVAGFVLKGLVLLCISMAAMFIIM